MYSLAYICIFIIYRKINKEKKKKKQKVRALMRESGIDIQKVKTRKMADSTCKQRIVLDMSYDNLMSFKVSYLYLVTIIIMYSR